MIIGKHLLLKYAGHPDLLPAGAQTCVKWSIGSLISGGALQIGLNLDSR
jgi:hypothetical protein